MVLNTRGSAVHIPNNWDPYNRLIRVFYTSFANMVECDTMIVSIGDFTRTVKVTEEEKYWNQKVTTDVPYDFLADSLAARVQLFNGPDCVLDKKVTVFHNLETSYPFSDHANYLGKEVTNFEITGRKFCASEAVVLQPDNFSGFSFTKTDARKEGLCRPYFDFAGVFQLQNGQYVVYGPYFKGAEVRVPDAVIKQVSGIKYPLFDRLGVMPSFEASSNRVEVEPETIPSSMSRRCVPHLVFANGEYEVDYEINQGDLGYDGLLVAYPQIHKLLVVMCHAEYEGLPDPTYRFERVGGAWYCPELDHDYLMAKDDVKVKDTVERFLDSDKSGVWFIVGNHRVAIIRRGSAACHALSLAVMFARAYSYTTLNVISSLFALASTGAIVPVKSDDGEYEVFEGRTSLWKGDGNADLTIANAAYIASFKNLQRKTYYSLEEVPEDEVGLAILGCDPFMSDVQKGRPDHYIVVRVNGRHLEAVYDPYRDYNYFKPGADVTALLDQKTSVLIVYSAAAVAVTNNGSQVA